MKSKKSESNSYKCLLAKWSLSNKSCDHLFFKRHHSRLKSDQSTKCDIFVCGIPPFYNEECIRTLFEEFGQISSIDMELVENGFQVSYVHFEDENGVKEALKCNFDEPRIVGISVRTGVKEYAKKYKKRIAVNPVELQKEIDTFMEGYDEAEAVKKAKLREERNQPDDEGWITVSKKGKTPVRSEFKNEKLLKKYAKKLEKDESVNFYRFQVKETKMMQIRDLKQKFEKDKKRLKLMKAARTFKPV